MGKRLYGHSSATSTMYRRWRASGRDNTHVRVTLRAHGGVGIGRGRTRRRTVSRDKNEYLRTCRRPDRQTDREPTGTVDVRHKGTRKTINLGNTVRKETSERRDTAERTVGTPKSRQWTVGPGRDVVHS